MPADGDLTAALKRPENYVFAAFLLVHPDAQWSHPSYPILLPAWLAYFSSFSAQHNERMASAGVPVLFGAILALVWRLARSGPASAKAAAVLGVAFFAFSCAVLFVTPMDIYRHVHGALARLMLYSGAFLLLAALLFAAEIGGAQRVASKSDGGSLRAGRQRPVTWNRAIR